MIELSIGSIIPGVLTDWRMKLHFCIIIDFAILLDGKKVEITLMDFDSSSS